MASTESIRLVRCPKCLNILPESPNVAVYKCGGCGTTLRAKIRASNGQHVARKQVRQDSDNYSVATSVSNGVLPQKEDQEGSIGAAAVDSSFNADTPSAAHDSNGTKSNENGDDMLTEQNAAVLVESTETKDDRSLEDQDTDSKVEGPAGPASPNANGRHLDSGESENHTVQRPEDNSETCRVREGDDSERRLNDSENNMLSSEMNKADVSMQDPEQHEAAGEAEHAANKKGHLVRVLSRSCDLRASGDSLDFHSARTSLQSKSFRASEPLQSKIMNTVDELKGDLSELFNKPAVDRKPKAYHPPCPSKQDGHMTRATITSSAPLAAYHPAAMHSGYAPRQIRSGQVAAPRQSRSGQVAPRGLPPMRYRRHRVYSCHHHSVQMEMRPCRHECCHSCQPPCYRSCRQEPTAMHKPPISKEIKRRPLPRNHCLPVLGGAPFVICSSCVSLVQLPTDFAVPSRGTRRLQCGSCSEVLSYSYRDPGRKKAQSPFGGDEYSTDDYEIRHHRAAAAGGFEQADPVSYSEEYGLSFGVSQSTSTEGGHPLYVSRNSSFNTVDERTGRDGKLHRLLGYSSASELLRHSPDLFESFDGRTPSARAHVDGKPAARTTHDDGDRKGKGVVCAAGSGYDAGERDSAVKRPKARNGGLPLHGILKKGIHGLESLKRSAGRS